MIPMKKYVAWLFILFLLSGCGIFESDDAGNGRANDGAATESNEDVAEDELEYDGEPPAEGKGNVFGEIRWNGDGAADLEVLLCADFSSFSGCGGEEFLTTTDEDGQYLFEEVDPGVYALSVRVFNSDDWLYISSGILSSAEFEVEAGKTLTIGIQNIFKLDVKLQDPPNGSKVAGEEVLLDWQDYPNAEYYKVTMYPNEGDAVLIDKRSNESSLRADLLPVSCGYRWSVEVFNSDRVKIAETAEDFDFVVDSLDGSCQLAIQEPSDGAEIRGDDIVLDWDDSPLATTYKILMWNDDDPERTNVLDFEEVNESSYRFKEPLAPARYVWSVTAYDENGDKIGGTEIFDFTVRP
ncbi:carboxypeptidase-like regulatory domain-containing protein [Candidatus Leptofilum sp.]|uniref:carboxypeptidase-like regulatory domain-containing protein n=1 Tax=Candidatus Leptofilum sp. TaxID=3241576 RepID=UPI003B58E474